MLGDNLLATAAVPSSMAPMTICTDRHSHWQRFWTIIGTETASWYQARPSLTLALIDAMGLTPEATTIDVGGGDSRLVDALLERGWRNLAVLDWAEAALERSARRLGDHRHDVTWIVADVVEWIPAPRLFQLWHDRACLHFLVDGNDQRRYATAMAAAVAPGGFAIIGAMAPGGPETCAGLPIIRHDQDGLERLMGEHFMLVNALDEIHITPQGRRQPYRRWIFQRK